MSTNSKAKRLNKSLIFPILGAILSAVMNGWYGWNWDPYAIGGAGLAAGALIADGFKPSLAPAIRQDINNRALGAALMKSLVLALLVIISAGTAFSFVASAIEKTTGPAIEKTVIWMELKQQKSKMMDSLELLVNVRPPSQIEANITAIKSAIIKTKRGTFTVGYLMECSKVGTKDYGPISQQYCPTIAKLKTDLQKSLNKMRVIAIIKRITGKMDKIGAPKEIDPGMARAGALLDIDKDTLRTALLASMAIAIELIATFGQLLGKSAQPRPAQITTRPKTVHEWLTVNADRDGTLQAGYEDMARALNISKSTAWRHAKKLIDAGIITHDNGQFAFS